MSATLRGRYGPAADEEVAVIAGIDADALRAGLEQEQRELRAAVAADEAALATRPDDERAAALELRRSQLRRVDAALAKHEAGTWETCVECGGLLTAAQLRAVPTAVHCEQCAQGEVFWGDTTTISLDELGLGSG